MNITHNEIADELNVVRTICRYLHDTTMQVADVDLHSQVHEKAFALLQRLEKRERLSKSQQFLH